MRKAFIAGILCISILLMPGGTVSAAVLSEPNGAAATISTSDHGTYVEGEALAIVRDNEKPWAAGQAERLAEVGPEAVQAVIREWEKSGYGGTGVYKAEAGQPRKQNADTFTIWSITDRHKTADQLVQELQADPKVVAAEPNYLVYADKGLQEENKSAVPAEAGKADLSFMQWYAGGAGAADSTSQNSTAAGNAANSTAADSSAHAYTTPLSPGSGYSMEVPGWQEGRTNKDAPANASGTICIMDTGIDTDHPDLQGVLYEFTPEQQAKYGCGKYGYNASGDGRPETEQKAVESHGTHVAGIIAANWNGEGVSGVANGVKIFSVNVFGGNGSEQDMKSVIKGFQFLAEAAQEINLKAVNCSWGTVQPQFILDVMVDELGRKGVNTVIASGNRYCDLDESIDLGSQVHSEYAVVVNGASMDGGMADFSCWGQDSTDVFAPGSEILSDVPATLRDEINGELYSYQDNTQFYPEATPTGHLLSGIERFDGVKPGVRFFDINPALSSKAQELGEINLSNGFDDKRSVAFSLSMLKKEVRRENGGFSAVNGYMYMAIPVPSEAAPKWIGVKTAMSDGFKPSGGIDSITCKGADGKPVEIDSLCVSALKKGLNASAFYTIYQCQWTPLSFNIDGFIGASNELHGMLQKGMTEEARRELGIMDYKDPGEITGIYEWKDGEQAYLIARIGIGDVTPDSRSLEVTKDTALYIDNVAVGDANAFTGPYMMMSGTSMAAPMVAGCLGVIAKGEPESITLSGEQLAQEARERAAKLLAAVDYDDALSGLCSTGGRVILHGQTEFVRKAPLISRAQAEKQELRLEGWYFGAKGTLAVDGTVIETKAWQDDKIVANIRALPNGSHVATVTNEDGAVNRAVFSVSSPDLEGRMLFEGSHSLPIGDPAFIENRSDRIYGPLAVSGGKIYAMAQSAKYCEAQGFWCYDIAQDTWSTLAMPDGFDTQSVAPAAFASLRDRLYLYGVVNYKDENGEDATRPCLWRYEPYGDFWEQLQITMPVGAGGICTLGENLFVIGGYVIEPEPEGEAGDQEDSFMPGIYKADVARGALVKLGGNLPANCSTIGMKLAAGKDKIYIYAKYEDDYSEEGQSTEDPSAASESENLSQGNSKTVSEGMLLRGSYNAAQNMFTFEDVTPALDESLGAGLRTEFEYKMGADDPAEHFAIAGLEDGVAIIGSQTAGEDVHILYDTEEQVSLYDRATCYHKAFDPIAVFSDGTLYVMGINTTEPEVMYFRSDTVKPRATAEGSGAGLGTEAQGGILTPRVIGWVTIGLFAAVAGALMLKR